MRSRVSTLHGSVLWFSVLAVLTSCVQALGDFKGTGGASASTSNSGGTGTPASTSTGGSTTSGSTTSTGGSTTSTNSNSSTTSTSSSSATSSSGGPVEETCAMALGAKGTCAGGVTVLQDGGWGLCSIKAASHDTCVPGNDDTCDGSPNDGCICLDKNVQACGNCMSGTRTCDGKSWPGKWGPCVGQTGCAPGSSQPCPPNYPYSCTASQTCDPSTCQWGACVDSCMPFTPDCSMPGVDCQAFLHYPAGPDCFKTSITDKGPWQVCPNGSHIDNIYCQVEPGSNGYCTVTNQSSTGAGIEVTSPNNCFASTTAHLVVTCISN
jgi:hypothetical protein